MEKKLLIIYSLVSIFLLSCSKEETENDVLTKGNKNIVETGELAAANSRAFVLEEYRGWWQMKIIGILEHGSIVQPGDSIIQLDPTGIQQYIIQRETNLETQNANMEKLLVDLDSRRNELLTSIKNEKASFNLKKIELDASQFESERYKKIKELEFEQAKIAMAKEERRLELNKIISENDIKIQQMRIDQMKRDIQNNYDILDKLTIRTPIGGVFQVGRNHNGNLIKVSDDIYAGTNMASVPDLEWMKVNTYINETDFLKIYSGQKVAVRLDAMPNIIFDGEISYIGKLCHIKDYNSKSRQKVFDVEVKILKSDSRLKPGMTVSCEYLN